MTPLLAAIAICLSDWGIACTHMAYDVSRRKPFYDRRLPRPVKDVWHLVGGLRYVSMTLLAVLTFSSWEWYVGTALVNRLGWAILKHLHGKDWPQQWEKS